MSYLSPGEAAREIHRLAKLCTDNNKIDPELYDVYHVKKGLREANGKGVLTGLTEISTIHGSREIDGKIVPIEGELYYRGIDINKLVDGFTSENRFGFEETIYLLIFGKLPNEEELDEFNHLLAYNRNLPDDICVTEVSVAGDRFHARYNAKGKTYRYTCYAGELKPVFVEDTVIEKFGVQG